MLAKHDIVSSGADEESRKVRVVADTVEQALKRLMPSYSAGEEGIIFKCPTEI